MKHSRPLPCLGFCNAIALCSCPLSSLIALTCILTRVKGPVMMDSLPGPCRKDARRAKSSCQHRVKGLTWLSRGSTSLGEKEDTNIEIPSKRGEKPPHACCTSNGLDPHSCQHRSSVFRKGKRRLSLTLENISAASLIDPNEQKCISSKPDE